jgi:hypothetical protein
MNFLKIFWQDFKTYKIWRDSSIMRVSTWRMPLKISKDFEGPIRRTKEGEWMGADKNSSRRRWKLQQDEHGFQHTSPTHYPNCQAHVATGVPLDLGTNTQPSDPRTQRNTKPRAHWPTPVRPVSTTGQTGLCWWNMVTSTNWLHTGQAGATHLSDRSKPESPQIAK